MSQPVFSGQDRLLVLAPHPDDETIAAGIAIQSALAAGADVCILHATDGDDNPWPQRWLEKRVRIGPAERARWGALRRAEALRAHAALAVDGRVAQARFLGWPDQGLTEALMRDDAALTQLADAIAAFAPTCILMPALDDAHPDHSALHVMAELALLRVGIACARHAYVVHGGEGEVPGAIELQYRERKRVALEAYASQLALSRTRLERYAGRIEAFTPVTRPANASEDAGVRIALGSRAPSAWPHEILVVLALRGAVLRLRAPWPRFARARHRLCLADAAGRTFEAEVADDALHIDPGERVLAGFAKRHRAGGRVVVFDRTRWHATGEGGQMLGQALARDVAEGIG